MSHHPGQGRVLGISGSPRKRSNSEALLGFILSGAKAAGTAVTACRLRDYRISACIGCELCRKDGECTGLDDDMHILYPELTGARGLVLVTPVHNYNVSAMTKAFIDRLYRFYDFGDARPRPWSSRLAGQGRKAVIAAVGEQPDPESMGVVMEAMRLPLTALGYEIVGELLAYPFFDAAAVKDDTAVTDRARELGKALAQAVAPA